jgi:beta propeller repeat protein
MSHSILRYRRHRLIAILLCMPFPMLAYAQFTIRQIADETHVNRKPTISETGLVAWEGTRMERNGSVSEIFIHTGGVSRALTAGVVSGNNDPQVYSNNVVWVTTTPSSQEAGVWRLIDPPLDPEHPEVDARWGIAPESGNEIETQRFVHRSGEDILGAPLREDTEDRGRRTPSGVNRIMQWREGEFIRIANGPQNDLGPAYWGDLVAWQKARGWPFGWEVMVAANGQMMQLTTNLFYDMAPRVHQNQVVWYGWDGSDFEIFLYNHNAQTITQITDNDYDDVSPQIWGDMIVWEAFPAANSDIFMWRDDQITKLSTNIEDDLNVRVWNGQAVWQSFDGDFFQIYHFDGRETQPLTNTRYDNVNPDIRDDIIVWMGYVDNFDAEIFAWTGGPDPIRLTDNDHEDQHPRTAGGRIVWQADVDDKSHIYLAEP